MAKNKTGAGFPRVLAWVLVTALLLLAAVLLLDTWIDSLNHRLLTRAADLAFDISVAYIVSYMFYYLTVRLKYEKDLPGRMKYVSMRLGNILRNSELLERELMLQANAYGIEMDSPPGDDQIGALSHRINPQEAFTQISDLYDGSVNWFDAMDIILAQINESKQEIILLSPEIDVELIGLLDEITDCSLSRMAHMPRKDSVKNVTGWEFPRFFGAIDRIREYKYELDEQLARRRRR